MGRLVVFRFRLEFCRILCTRVCMYSVGVYSLGSSVASRFIRLVLDRVLFFIRCRHTYTCRNVVVGFSFLFYYYYYVHLMKGCSGSV